MTEAERIRLDGIVPEDFFREEVICDYLVTEKAKKIQAIGLDILLKFDSVCKRHNLQYFLAFGTLLGAVRHKGFIPWDDDIDVLMPRKDYEKLVLFGDEFTVPYFFQTPMTDPGYLYSITRIRNSLTCNFTIQRGYWGWNGGIWMDVFPLDKCELEDREKIYQEVDMLNSLNSAYMKIPSPYMNSKGKKLILDNLSLSPIHALQRITDLSTKYKDIETSYVTDYSTTVYEWNRIVWNKEDFVSSVDLDFLGYRFPVPIGYESVLRTTYGDYMKLPPIEARGHWHDGHITNPDRPYTDVFDELGIHRN